MKNKSQFSIFLIVIIIMIFVALCYALRQAGSRSTELTEVNKTMTLEDKIVVSFLWVNAATVTGILVVWFIREGVKLIGYFNKLRGKRTHT